MKGYVTVFFSLITALSLSLLLGLLYGARESAIRMKINHSMNASMDAVMAEYNRELLKQYGLLFVDMSYQSGCEAGVLTEEHLISFLNKNFDESGVLWGGIDFLALSSVNSSIDKVRLATDDGGLAIRKQAIEAEKRKTGVSYIEDMLSLIENYEKYNIKATENYNKYKDKESDENKEAILNNANIDAVTIEKEDDQELRLLSSVRLCVDDPENVSLVKVNEDSLASKRVINQGNYEGEDTEADDTEEKILFRKYLLDRTGNYLDIKESSVLKYETEYLIAGHSEDQLNLESIINRLLVFREGINIYEISNNEETLAGIRAAALIIALLLGLNEGAVEGVIIAGLAAYRSVKEVKTLLQGGSVHLYDETSREVNYKDFLNIFLYLTNTQKLTERLTDIIELDIRNTDKNEDFMIDKCFDAVEMTAYITSDFGYSYEITRKRNIEN